VPDTPAYADELDYVQINDFRPGIYSKSYKVVGGLAVPAPLGAAQLNGTFSCIALPTGGLAPLPAITDTMSVPLPDTDVNATLGYFNVDGFMTFGPVGPGPGGRVDDLFLGIEYLNVDGAHRIFTYYRVDPVSGTDPFPSDQLVQVSSTQNPISEQYMGMSFAVSRMNPSSPFLTPGTPVVVTAWAPPGFAADQHVWAFPDPSEPSDTEVIDLCVPNRPTNTGETNVGDILGHQGRIVMLEYLTNAFGARAGDLIPTNEQISFSDPANSFDAFGGGSPYTIGIQQQVFAQEFPNGYGAWGSISAGELFLVKHQGGGVLVTGDIASPTVTRLPGVVSTGGMTCRAASTPLGLFYYARFSGVYIWRGADTSDKISQNLEDDFIFYSPGPDKFVNTAVQIQEWADWVVTTNGFLYDTISGGWWRLDNPATYIPQWFGRGFFADDLYAIPCRLNNTTKTGAVRKYNRRTPAHTYSWQSQPIPRYVNRLAEEREYVLVAEGAGTVVVSATNIDGSTGGTETQTFTLPAQAASQQVRLRLPCLAKGYDITVKIVATGSGGSGAAPIVHSIAVGAHQIQEAIER
jgi:hypothetical protein